MSRVLILLVFFCCMPALNAVKPLIDRIADRIDSVNTYRGTVIFEVTQPMTDEEVRYKIGLNYSKQPVDTLCGYYYYLDVDSESNPAISGDFMTYYSGNYLSFSNNKLREYHADENVEPFRTKVLGRRTLKGVHRSGLFMEELPVEISEQLRYYRNHPQVVLRQYEDTVREGRRVDMIEADEYDRGELARSVVYVFDRADGMPVYKEVESSPGHLASQTVTTHYLAYTLNEPFPEDYFTENRLIREKKNVFAGVRNNLYRLYSLKGQPAPDFTLPVYGGANSMGLHAMRGKPVILAFLSTDGGFCPETADILARLSRLPVQVLTLFDAEQSDEVKDFVSRYRLSCPVLYDAAGVKALYGVTGYPSLFVVDSGLTIISVYAGYEPGLEEKLTSDLQL